MLVVLRLCSTGTPIINFFANVFINDLFYKVDIIVVFRLLIPSRFLHSLTRS